MALLTYELAQKGHVIDKDHKEYIRKMLEATAEQNWKYEGKQCNYHQLEHDPIYYDLNLAAESVMTDEQKWALSAYRKFFPHFLNHKLGLSDAFLLTGSMQNEMYLMHRDIITDFEVHLN